MNKNFLAIELDKVLKKLSEQACSDKAKEKILNILPSNDIKKTHELLMQTQDAHMLIGRFGAPSFYGIKDIEESIKKASVGGVLTPSELLKISSTLSVMRGVKEWKKQFNEVSTSIDRCFNSINANKYLEGKINSCIISDDEFADTASPELNRIRKKIRNINDKIRTTLDSMIKSAKYRKYLQEGIVTVRNDRFVIPVKAECRTEISGLVHDTSSSGATIFIEPMGVVNDNNEIRVLLSKEKDEINKILKELSEEVGRFRNDILLAYKFLIELDIIFAKASLGYSMKASIPIVNNEGKIKIKKARHPMISANQVIPMNIELGVEFDTLIITGPNTGGKTVSLKVIGLFCAMAMCGMMIPAEEGSTVSVFDNILVDIGDEQSIEQSLSTFSSHIKNIVSILSKCSGRSLVLLDEIGAGTDPVEGAALAMSIIETLREKGAKIAVTTHYKELKEYALRTQNIENGSCEFDVYTMKPTYKLILGIPGKSNAFLISERLGIDRVIIDRAKKFTNEDDSRLEEIILSLEERRQKLEQEYKNVERLRLETESLKAENEKIKQEIECQRNNVINKSREEAKKILDEVICRSEMVFEELENLKNLKHTVSADKRGLINSEIKTIENLADPVDIQKLSTDKKQELKFNIGDFAFVSDFNKEGEILSDEDSSGRVLVRVGAIKTRVLKKNLSLTKNKDKRSKVKGHVTKNVKSRTDMNVSTDIDLRGENIIDATIQLDSFIDTCVMAGIKQITIIHGKGTGQLRKGIHDYLKTNKQVKRFRIGNFGEGETGVTIVELK